MILQRKSGLITSSRAKQRGTIGHFQSTIVVSAGVVPVVTVTGSNLLINVLSGFVELEFRPNGQVWWQGFSGFSQLSPDTDWIIPNDHASSEYDIRYVNFAGDPLFSEPAAENVWIDLGADRTWSLTGLSPGNVCTFDVEIRLGVTTLSSAEYQLVAAIP